MATSPRYEIAIEAIVVFGKFDGGWVWAEQKPDGSVENDSGSRVFADAHQAVFDYFEKQGVDLKVPVLSTEAHWSKLVRITPEDKPIEEYHIRKYAYGAPDPIQAVL